jgi:plasmid stabilization system protein ParE
MRLRFSPRAVGDIAAIGNYLTERNPIASRAVGEKIRATVELLRQFPAIGRTLEQRKDVRVMPITRYPYLVYYTFNPDDMLILHIRHTARAPIEPDEL